VLDNDSGSSVLRGYVYSVLRSCRSQILKWLTHIYLHILKCLKRGFQTQNWGNYQWFIQTVAERILMTAKPGMGKNTDDLLLSSTANIFSYLQWPPTTCMHAMINTELSSVTPSHFLSNLSSLQCMHQSNFIASSSF
jgi:hypothetical protein